MKGRKKKDWRGQDPRPVIPRKETEVVGGVVVLTTLRWRSVAVCTACSRGGWRAPTGSLHTRGRARPLAAG